MSDRYLFQKPRKDGDAGTVYHWTPALAKKKGFVEITAEQAKRLSPRDGRPGEDYRVVLAPTDERTGAAEVPAGCTLMAVPDALVPRVRDLIDKAGKPEEIVVPIGAAGADAEFKGVPEPADEADTEEGPNLRSVEVVKVEKARTKNAIEDLAAEYFPDEAGRPALARSMSIDEMRQTVIEALQARILAEAEG